MFRKWERIGVAVQQKNERDIYDDDKKEEEEEKMEFNFISFILHTRMHQANRNRVVE